MASNEPPRFLLLLPPAPSPPSHVALKAAFGETITEVLKQFPTQASDTPKGTVLEIALALPHLVGRQKASRSSLYAETQSIIAGVYKLICNIAAREEINVEDADGIDVRILLVAWKPELVADGPSVTDEYAYGPVITLESMARSGRAWQYAFGVESEAGEAMLRAFLTAQGNGEHAPHAQGGPVTKDASSSTTGSAQTASSGGSAASSQLHRHTIIGGTFDHIHIGHKLLLTMLVFTMDKDALSEGERSATIGITGDEMLRQKKHAEWLESWADRQRGVATFINALIDFAPPAATGQRHVSIRDDPGPNGKSLDIHYPDGVVIKCTEIQDAYGPTITEEQLTAIVVSAETRAGGKAVNDKRVEKGWKALQVFEVDVLDAEDDDEGKGPPQEGFESKLSSTAIREKLASKKQSSL